MATKGHDTNKAKATKVKFRYIFPDDYNPVYVNGTYGGITSRGEIAMNFYLERQALPYEVVHKLSDKGEIKEQISREPEESEDTVTAVRFISTGVVLSYDTAVVIRDWLSGKISDVEKILNKGRNGE